MGQKSDKKLRRAYLTGQDIGCWDGEDRAAKGSGYKGALSTSRTGLTCQKWTKQSPHKHGYTPKK